MSVGKPACAECGGIESGERSCRSQTKLKEKLNHILPVKLLYYVRSFFIYVTVRFIIASPF